MLLFLAIQQLQGNFLTPNIQVDTLHVHPILVFLAVTIGGGLAGILGVIMAVPALAILRILFDFFRVRLRTDDQREGREGVGRPDSGASAPPRSKIEA